MTPLSPNDDKDHQTNIEEASSGDISFTHFMKNLKADNPPRDHSVTKTRSALPLSKSALSYDFLAIDTYISPHDISISIGKDIEKSKKKVDNMGEVKSAKKPPVHRDYSQITNINDSDDASPTKLPQKNRFLNEKSVKLSHHSTVKDTKTSQKNRKVEPQKFDRKLASPKMPIVTQKPVPTFHCSPYVPPPSSNVFVNMMNQINEYQSKQFQMMIECHHNLMSKLIDKAFD